MLGSDIKADVQAILDDTGIQWIDENLLRWINAGGREISTLKPKAATLRRNIPLAAGVTVQDNPEGVVQVLELTANMGAAGTTPGRAISTVSEERLRAVRPNWRRETGAAVKHLVIDDREPGTFLVWPAPSAATQVEALILVQFAELAALSDTISLDDSYRNALGEYVLHCAYAMEGDGFNAEVSALHYTKFAQLLGIQVQKQKRASAPANSAENPTHPAVDKNGA